MSTVNSKQLTVEDALAEIAILREALSNIKLAEIEYAASLSDGLRSDSYNRGCIAGLKHCASIAREALKNTRK